MGWEFLVTSFVVVIAPGAGVLFTVATGLSNGAGRSAIAAFGCTLGIVPHMAAAILGLAALLKASVLAYEIFRYAGVAYLLYVAWETLRQRGPLAVTAGSTQPSALKIIPRAILINLLNPKLSVYFLAFLPQFVSAESTTPLSDMLVLSGTFMMMTLLVFIGYGALAATVRDRILASAVAMRWLRSTVAAAFVGLGVRLALSDR